MNILEIAKLLPQDKKVAIKVGETDNIWPVTEVVKYYDSPSVKKPEVIGIDTVYCPEFGDEEPMVQLTIK